MLLIFLLQACQPTPAVGEDTASFEADDTGSADTGLDDGGSDDGGSDDGGADDTDGGSSDNGSDDPTPTDYRDDGPYGVADWTEQHAVSSSCNMEVSIYAPLDAEETALVILAHGFSRGPDQVIGWAQAFASWGLTVAVPELCHASIWDTDHEANGTEMVALADALGLGPAIYAGHSAGGLAAIVAAAEDPNAVAALGLDATDASGIGVSYAGAIQAPVFGLLGESSYCNSYNNGADIYARASDVNALRVTDSDHCDYEDETDWACTSFCQNSSANISDSAIHSSIQGLSTAALMGAAGLDDAWEDWWVAGGGYYDDLASRGEISPL